MQPERNDELQQAMDAWDAWCAAKRKSDRTLSFADCHDTAQCWLRFQNLYLGDNSKLAAMPKRTATVLSFGGSA